MAQAQVALGQFLAAGSAQLLTAVWTPSLAAAGLSQESSRPLESSVTVEPPPILDLWPCRPSQGNGITVT